MLGNKKPKEATRYINKHVSVNFAIDGVEALPKMDCQLCNRWSRSLTKDGLSTLP